LILIFSKGSLVALIVWDHPFNSQAPPFDQDHN
jgi:hypothetical protein